MKAAREFIAQSLPEALERLRPRHEAFQALLQTNLTVLATAHAVSEGIIRGVSGELARKQAPSTYGASGRANAPGAQGQPAAGGQPHALVFHCRKRRPSRRPARSLRTFRPVTVSMRVPSGSVRILVLVLR